MPMPRSRPRGDPRTLGCAPLARQCLAMQDASPLAERRLRGKSWRLAAKRPQSRRRPVDPAPTVFSQTSFIHPISRRFAMSHVFPQVRRRRRRRRPARRSTACSSMSSMIGGSDTVTLSGASEVPAVSTLGIGRERAPSRSLADGSGERHRSPSPAWPRRWAHIHQGATGVNGPGDRAVRAERQRRSRFRTRRQADRDATGGLSRRQPLRQRAQRRTPRRRDPRAAEGEPDPATRSVDDALTTFGAARPSGHRASRPEE